MKLVDCSGTVYSIQYWIEGCSSDVTERCCQTSTSRMLSRCNHVFVFRAFLWADINIFRLTYVAFLSWIGRLIISVPIKSHQHIESAACYEMLTTIQCSINVHRIIKSWKKSLEIRWQSENRHKVPFVSLLQRRRRPQIFYFCCSAPSSCNKNKTALLK